MIALLVLVVLIGAALELNHRRRRRPSTPGIAANGVPDRDTERVVADLEALS